MTYEAWHETTGENQKRLIGVPSETYPGERRAALTPVTGAAPAKFGSGFLLEEGAGHAAGFERKT